MLNEDFIASKLSDAVFILLINVEMPTMVELSMKKVLSPLGLILALNTYCLKSLFKHVCTAT